MVVDLIILFSAFTWTMVHQWDVKRSFALILCFSTFASFNAYINHFWGTESNPCMQSNHIIEKFCLFIFTCDMITLFTSNYSVHSHTLFSSATCSVVIIMCWFNYLFKTYSNSGCLLNMPGYGFRWYNIRSNTIVFKVAVSIIWSLVPSISIFSKQLTSLVFSLFTIFSMMLDDVR